MNFDYRYSKGRGYNGPVWWNTNVFEGTGINLVVNTFSGTPYSRRVQAYPLTAGANTVQLAGQVNGSRLPWQFRIDLRMNKQFDVNYGKDKNKSLGMDVYIQIQNLLDTRNVLGVYPYTGSAEDDGYLTSAQAQNVIQSQVSSQSFVDLYNVAMVNPFSFSLPRRIRLGLIVNF
jgi:hypothetical protein